MLKRNVDFEGWFATWKPIFSQVFWGRLHLPGAMLVSGSVSRYPCPIFQFKHFHTTAAEGVVVASPSLRDDDDTKPMRFRGVSWEQKDSCLGSGLDFKEGENNPTPVFVF